MFQRNKEKTESRTIPAGVFFAGLGAVCLLGALPMLLLYLRNHANISFSAVASPLCISVLIYALVYTALSCLSLRPGFSLVLGGTGTWLLMNFGSIAAKLARLTGSLTGAYGILALGCVLLLVLLFLLSRKLPEELLNLFPPVLAAVLGVVLVLNTVTAFLPQRQGTEAEPEPTAAPVTQETIPADAAPVAETEPEPAAEAEPELSAAQLREMILSGEYESSGLPNFYFLVFDEMGGMREMEHVYGYDTSSFRAYLEANRVNYSVNSESVSLDTFLCLDDLFLLKPGTSSFNPAYELRPDTPLRQQLEGLGYRLYSADVDVDVYAAVPELLKLEEKTSGEGATVDGQSPEDIAYENSILRLIRSLRSSYEPSYGNLLSSEEIRQTEDYLDCYDQTYANNALEVLDYLEDPANYVPYSGIATFVYTQITHMPFVFKADGSILESALDRANWTDPEVYLGTYNFTVAHIEKILDTILENDPDSVIVIMSDHGVRYHDDCAHPTFTMISDSDAHNVINLVYYRGQSLYIEGLSPVNTLRAVLMLMGADVELLDGVNPDRLFANS